MKEFILLAVIAAALLFAPIISLWSLNTISEQSSMGWYIPHNLWTYLSIYGLAAVFKGAK